MRSISSRKAKIFFISTILSLSLFLILMFAMRNVSHLIYNSNQWRYITPSSTDTLYTILLQDTFKREKVVNFNNKLQSFYSITDSLKTILDVELSQDLVIDIIVNKGMAKEVYVQLIELEKNQIILCDSLCFSVQYENIEKWNQYFFRHSKKEIHHFIDGYIKKVKEAEKRKLREWASAID